ncbi:MAG: nitroreductase [Firmicutes bacterium HGW-Firmicutes-15]|nr:MAG: nitroreductase [Firmicutes bacterium HGW-Firmicutes-15]
MEFFDVIKNRRAVRQYKPDLLSKEDILKILDAGNWAPSGRNLQQWDFIVVSGEKKIEMGKSYKVISEVYTADWEQSARDAFVQYAATYGGAPVIIVVLTDADKIPGIRKMNLESASAAMENILLAARALGLGTCWMTGPLQDEASIRQILHIPESKEIVAVTPLGYPVAFPEAPPRLDPELRDKVSWIE